MTATRAVHCCRCLVGAHGGPDARCWVCDEPMSAGHLPVSGCRDCKQVAA